MLRLKFAVKPLPWAKVLDRGFKTLANNLSYYSVAPLQTDRKVAFIAGCGHSGTSLLAAKLSIHSAVFTVGRESNNFSIMRNLYCSREIVREWCYTAEQHGKPTCWKRPPSMCIPSAESFVFFPGRNYSDGPESSRYLRLHACTVWEPEVCRCTVAGRYPGRKQSAETLSGINHRCEV